MNTQRRLATTCFIRATAPLLLALATTVLPAPTAHAEAETQARFQPSALIQAELALAQGQPGRALSLLHRQRAILRHNPFRAQAAALSCQAYRQMEDLQKAAQVCGEVVAQDRGSAVAGAFDHRLGRE